MYYNFIRLYLVNGLEVPTDVIHVWHQGRYVLHVVHAELLPTIKHDHDISYCIYVKHPLILLTKRTKPAKTGNHHEGTPPKLKKMVLAEQHYTNILATQTMPINNSVRAQTARITQQYKKQIVQGRGRKGDLFLRTFIPSDTSTELDARSTGNQSQRLKNLLLNTSLRETHLFTTLRMTSTST